MPCQCDADDTVLVRSDVWAVVHTERAALADDLADVPAAAWSTPSLCAGWDVRDVLAHIADTATLSGARFVKELILTGFSPARIVDKQIRAGRTQSPAELLDALRTATYRTASPPQPTITRLIEIVVHAEDIRRPLQITHAYSTTHVAEALRYLARERRIGGRTRLSGLQLCATDADVVVGQGLQVRGPAVSLLVTAAGRRDAISELDGPGLQRLRERLE